jgi:hypothetical protein
VISWKQADVLKKITTKNCQNHQYSYKSTVLFNRTSQKTISCDNILLKMSLSGGRGAGGHTSYNSKKPAILPFQCVMLSEESVFFTFCYKANAKKDVF